MYPKVNRLNHQQFKSVFSQGRFLPSEFFTIKKLKADTYKVAVVIPKKVRRLAFLRNRWKRRIFNLLPSPAQYSSGYYILIAKKKITTLSSGDLKKEIDRIFNT